MRIEQVTVLKFEELTETAKEKARNWYRDCIGNDFYCEVEYITEDFKQVIEDAGFNVKNVYWSLSYCQGDGVCFEGSAYSDQLEKIFGKILDQKTFRNFKRLLAVTDVYAKVTAHDRSHTISVELDTDGNTWELAKVNELVDTLQEALQDYTEEVCHKCERDGYSQIDWLYSKEHVDEVITANEYEFTEDGQRW